MRLFKALTTVTGLTKVRIRSCEARIARQKMEISQVEDQIEQQARIIAAARNHLKTFDVRGETVLSELLESKARQASVKRKIAMSELQQSELGTQKRALQEQVAEESVKRALLHRKSDRLNDHLTKVKREVKRKQLNINDNDTEEQCNWKS